MKFSRGWAEAALLAIAALATSGARAEETPICTDRPAKANAVCTVPRGKVQLEASAVGWSLTRLGDTRTELLTVGSSFLKLGLSSRSDLQVGFTPYARLTAKQDGRRERLSGAGDVLVRYKHRLTRDGARFQAGVILFMKLPTAKKGLGNDKLEGGLAVPITFTLAGPVTMTVGPELDLLADTDGRGHHAAIVNLVNLSAPVARKLTLAGELWTNFNFDPSGTARQISADAALAYAASRNIQLDSGANLDLTRETPDVELYIGASMRF
jgi:hypothetical protein